MDFDNKRVGSIREMSVYQKSFKAAMRIFDLSKKFPTEEKFALTDQIRRSSRSICANLSEAWRKRKYEAVFRNKLSDCSQEAAETQTWLEFAYHCGYIDRQIFNEIDKQYEEIYAMLIGMDRKSHLFCS